LSDDYITILCNDEIHTYEQVCGTLMKVLNIDNKKSYEYASVVNREGRSAIKRGTKSECLQVETNVKEAMRSHHTLIQMSTDPLGTKVFHHSLCAHQYFAEKLLVWLQKISDCSVGLKNLLCKIGLTAPSPDEKCPIEKLFLSDCIFWKSARILVHQYFIGIYFMDPNWKKEFSVVYTKNYSAIWEKFVENQDDSESVTEISVQMFTVISIAKYLITNHNLLQIIMDTLIQHTNTGN
jgi:hypothetical protein